MPKCSAKFIDAGILTSLTKARLFLICFYVGLCPTTKYFVLQLTTCHEI